MSSFDRSTHRLAGSSNEAGGLIIKKKQDPNRDKSDETFKRPSGSLLGLDVLARRKRAEREVEEGSVRGEKRPKIERKWDKKDSNYDDSGVRISFGRSDVAKDRKYRSALLDTPSHPGGVSEQALEKMQNRLKRDQGQGLYASSSGGRGRERRERDQELISGREERERGRGREDDRGEESRRRVREREWEQETPRSDRGRGNTTPYLKTRGSQLITDHHVHVHVYSVCPVHITLVKIVGGEVTILTLSPVFRGTEMQRFLHFTSVHSMYI